MINYLGYEIVEDNAVSELRLPLKVIEYLQGLEIAKEIEFVFSKEIKKQKFSGAIYVPKHLVGKKAIIIVLK